jgi:hypothetical protein
MTTTAAKARPEGRIELRLRDVKQLFDSLDPAPFHEKDLDHDAEEFIVSWAREYPPNAPLVLELHLPRDQQALEPERMVGDAVRNYFAYRAEIAQRDVRRTRRQGRGALVIGLVFLVGCMALRELLRRVATGDWLHVAQEGLLILGWVAMWRPIELLLYDWRPLRSMRRTYERLAAMRVEVTYTD